MIETYTVTITSKGQITVPARLRRQLGLKAGDRFDIYPIGRSYFTAQLRGPSRILDFAGDLKELDRQLRQPRAARSRQDL